MIIINYDTNPPTVTGEEIKCCVPGCPAPMRTGDIVYLIPGVDGGDTVFDPTGETPYIMCGRYGKDGYNWTRARIG
ncbi:MAG: hypothetical protein GF368_02065 [Candidatus Aenigmarchaeota archaeon]|nr:hypothetical protein [Candidatus Aenigmarchaeota archaeon]